MRQFPTGVPPENITFEGDSQACTLLLPLARQMARRAWLAGQQVCQMRPTADSYIRTEITNGLARITIQAGEREFELRVMYNVTTAWRGLFDIPHGSYDDKPRLSQDSMVVIPRQQVPGSWHNEKNIALRWGGSRNYLIAEIGTSKDYEDGVGDSWKKTVAVSTTVVTVMGFPEASSIAAVNWGMPDEGTLVGVFWDGIDLRAKTFRFGSIVRYDTPLAEILIDPDDYGRSHFGFGSDVDEFGFSTSNFSRFNTRADAIAWARRDSSATGPRVIRFISSLVPEDEDQASAYTSYVLDAPVDLMPYNQLASEWDKLAQVVVDGPGFAFMYNAKRQAAAGYTIVAKVLGVTYESGSYVIDWSPTFIESFHLEGEGITFDPRIATIGYYSSRLGIRVFDLYENPDMPGFSVATSNRVVIQTPYGETSVLQKSVYIPDMFVPMERGITFWNGVRTSVRASAPNVENPRRGIALTTGTQWLVRNPDANNPDHQFRYVVLVDLDTGAYRVETDLSIIQQMGSGLTAGFFPSTAEP